MRTRVWATLILAVVVTCMPGCKKKEAVQDQPQGTSDTTPGAVQETKETPVMSVNQESFGRTSEGREVDLYTLTNSNGLKARITNYGAILVSLEVPDRTGKLADITLGFDTLDGYLGEHPHFGGVVGRYANRIGKARFVLDGVEYELAANDGDNHL